MADWGAGYANAASGLASIFMGKAQQNVRGREQAAEEARRLKDQKRQELMQLKQLEARKGEAEADRQFRMKLMKEESNIRSSERAAEREAEMNDPFRKAAEDRAERAIRVQEQYANRSAGGGGSSGGGLAQPQGPNQKDVDAARSMVETLMRQEKLSAAAAEERVAQMFSEEVAQRAFPGRSARIGQAAQTLQGLSQRAGAYFQ
jgi:hypothetical protein